METYSIPERRACRTLSVPRNTYRYTPVKREGEDIIRERIIEIVANYGRVGYRMVTDHLRNQGICINYKRVYRIWREVGLKVPKKQPKRRRVWLTDGSCIRLRADHQNHVWSYDFVEDKTQDKRKIRILNILDEYTRECLASLPRRKWRNNDVMEVLADLMLLRGTPEYLRSDNGSEFTSKTTREWLDRTGVITAYIEKGSPWENGFIESFNARMRDEFLNGELFDTLWEAQVLTERWIRYYNMIRPHSSLHGKPPAPQTNIPTTFQMHNENRDKNLDYTKIGEYSSV